MQATRFQPIAVRLTRAILRWGCIGAVLVGLLQGLYTQREAESRLQNELRRYVTVLASRVALAVYQVNPEAIQDQLEVALLIRGVGYAAVLDQGSPVVERGDMALREATGSLSFPIILPPEHASPEGASGTVPTQHGSWSGTKTIWTVPNMAGRQLGILKVVVDHAAIRREVTEAVVQAVLPCLLLTGLLLVLSLMVVRDQLQRPMRQITEFLNHLDAGRLGERLQLSRRVGRTRDEIDLVAAGFGGMQQRLAEHVQQLDARVAQRTEQLQTALDTLKTLAITDPLTGCNNRLAFAQKYPEAIAHAERYGRPLSVVFCDADRFKAVNDNHGHPVGDQVLAAMGRCLRDALRASSDWVARYGGEEFVLVLPETPLNQALDVAERVRQQIEQTLSIELPSGQILRVTASLGVAQHRAGESGEHLLSRADALLYAAKQAGRNQVQPPVAVTA